MVHTKNGAFEALIQDYCNKVGEQVGSVQTLLTYRHISSAHPRDVLANIHSEVHRMSGAAHCMGFRDLGNRLSRLERKLKKVLHRPVPEIEPVLQDAEERLVQINSVLPDITPENSRVLQLLNPTEEGEGASGSLNDEAVKVMLSGLRILIADDDPFVRALLETTLKDMSVGETKSVTSGLEVLGAIQAFKPDIVMTDWQMEPMSGFELLRCIRSGETPVAADTPIIFFTGEEDRSYMQSALSYGADRFLRKPVSPDILQKSLVHIVREKAGVL